MKILLKLLEPLPVMFCLFLLGVFLICKYIFVGIPFMFLGGFFSGILLRNEYDKYKQIADILPEPKKIEPKRTTDEKRYPMGWNACLRQIKRLKNN